MGNLIDHYYEQSYANVHSDGGLATANGAMHERLEAGRGNGFYPRTLELGAGNGEHLAHVKHGFDEYIATDIRAPSTNRLIDAYRLAHPERKIRVEQADCCALPFPDGFADRLVAGCLLMHLPDPVAALLEWQRVVSPDGVIDLIVPCDPGLLLRLFRRIVSERSAKRQGALDDYRLVNALDHVSSFPRLERIAQATTEDGRVLRVRYHPFKLRSWNLNAFAIFSFEPAACTEATH